MDEMSSSFRKRVIKALGKSVPGTQIDENLLGIAYRRVAKRKGKEADAESVASEYIRIVKDGMEFEYLGFFD